MYALELRTREVKYLRFEDVKNITNATIKIYDIQRKKRSLLIFLKNSIMKLRNMKSKLRKRISFLI